VGTVSLTLTGAVVAAVPVLVICKVYVAATPTTKLAGVALLIRDSCGAATVSVAVPVQCAAAGQLASPPPLTLALLFRLWPLTLACGVTGIV
jgi:hypothetical protein